MYFQRFLDPLVMEEMEGDGLDGSDWTADGTFLEALLDRPGPL